MAGEEAKVAAAGSGKPAGDGAPSKNPTVNGTAAEVARSKANAAKVAAGDGGGEEQEEEFDDSDTVTGMLKEWMRTQAPWWAMSFTVHMIVFALILVFGGRFSPIPKSGNAPEFDEAEAVVQPPDKPFIVGEPDPTPSVLDTSTLTMTEPPAQAAQSEQHIDDNPVFVQAGGGVATTATTDLGGLTGFDVKAFGPGPKVKGSATGGLGAGIGEGNNSGSGGAGTGFGGRGQGSREKLLGRYGGTKKTERAVAAALYWFARHQNKDGSWTLMGYNKQCKAGDKSCSGPGEQESQAAATGMALLPYLAAGQTHISNGPFRQVINGGIYWLISHQQPDGDLSVKAESQMYTHGLAAIALCEDYGISRDKTVGIAAQKAINFIQAAQNSSTGGWRYHPGEEGDTSVVGWQLMALKSAQMAGLQVNPATLEGTKKWLKSTSKGVAGGSKGVGNGQFSYQPDGGPTNSMTAVGLLCSQYLHAGRQDPVIVGGVQQLMGNQPNNGARDTYYWYYATQVLHNMADKDWDTWNRKMRTILVESQNVNDKTCAVGSWDPHNVKPGQAGDDAWGQRGGRVMMTSLSTLTLEVYYRYLPLYKLDKPEEIKAEEPLDMKAPGKDAKPMAKDAKMEKGK